MDWTDIVELGVILLAGWATWLSIPRAPGLDWQRLFKVAISVGIWAELESEVAAGGHCDGAPVEQRWRSALQTVIPFHPAGRDWRTKLEDPTGVALPVPALPGEQALVEALAGLSTVEERWSRLFGASAHAVDSTVAEALGDPRELGAVYDPTRLLGPEADWEGVSAWSDATRAGLLRRLSHVVVVEVGLPEGMSVCASVPGLRSHAVAAVDTSAATSWLATLEQPSDRLVLVLRGEHLVDALEQMASSPALVDRVVAILVVGGVAAPTPEARAHLQALISSEALLPELQRQTPIAAIDDISPDHLLESGMAPLDLPADEPERTGVQWLDLGPLPVDNVPAIPLSRALALLLAFLLDS